MDRLQALTQGDQALGVKEVVGPTLMIAAPASAFASAALAQDASQPASRVAVDSRKHVALAVLEVFKPALQQAVELMTDRSHALPACAPCLGAERFLEFGHALLARPFHASLEVIAKEVESSWLSRIHDPGFLRVKRQSIGFREVLDSPQGLLGLLFALTEYDEVSSAGELHPHALAEPDVSFAAHPAPTVEATLRSSAPPFAGWLVVQGFFCTTPWLHPFIGDFIATTSRSAPSRRFPTPDLAGLPLGFLGSHRR
jgi:hypothetical protein